MSVFMYVSIYLSIYLCLYIYLCLPVYLCLSVCLIYLFISMSVYLCLSIYLSMSACLSIYIYISMSYLSIYVYLSISLSMSIYVYQSTFCSLCDSSIQSLPSDWPHYVCSANYTKGVNCLKIEATVSRSALQRPTAPTISVLLFVKTFSPSRYDHSETLHQVTKLSRRSYASVDIAASCINYEYLTPKQTNKETSRHVTSVRR